MPFGEEIGAGVGPRTTTQGYSQTDCWRQKFTGYEKDVETGLDYAQARMFSGGQGRFTSVDIADASLTNPQSFNKYAYVYNNPLRYRDPDGLYGEDVHKYLTFVLAYAAGNTLTDSAKIAYENQRTDDNFLTSPWNIPAANILYHFASDGRRASLWQAFEEKGGSEGLTALGRFFHSRQDSYSHDGFNPIFGHFFHDKVPGWLNFIIGANVFQGNETDVTAVRPGKAMQMAEDTFGLLIKAAQIQHQRNGGIGTSPVSVSFEQIRRNVGLYLEATSQGVKDYYRDHLWSSVVKLRIQLWVAAVNERERRRPIPLAPLPSSITGVTPRSS